ITPTPSGFPMQDCALILLMPDAAGKYSVIYPYHERDLNLYSAPMPRRYMEALIAVLPDGTFEVEYKDKPFTADNWFSTNIEAVRHANGRDWWILLFKVDTPGYFTYLYDSSGFNLVNSDEMNNLFRGWGDFGQAASSPNGNYIARINYVEHMPPDVDIYHGYHIDLYTFDRCNGQLALVDTFNLPGIFRTGLGFSPSGRYLYTSASHNLWQWDLWANDIATSKILVKTLDGLFAEMLLAPDGRMYVTALSDLRYRHVIDRPDLSGEECRLLEHGIYLKTYVSTAVPSLPNFRLGPLDDSPCDTLGIDNLPVSRWRYEADAPDWQYSIRFIDLSFYEPETWHWDFGDGTTSDEVNPIHVFEPGYYKVCLTVINTHASDSSCKWLEILTTSLQEERAGKDDLSVG